VHRAAYRAEHQANIELNIDSDIGWVIESDIEGKPYCLFRRTIKPSRPISEHRAKNIFRFSANKDKNLFLFQRIKTRIEHQVAWSTNIELRIHPLLHKQSIKCVSKTDIEQREYRVRIKNGHWTKGISSAYPNTDIE